MRFKSLMKTVPRRYGELNNAKEIRGVKPKANKQRRAYQTSGVMKYKGRRARFPCRCRCNVANLLNCFLFKPNFVFRNENRGKNAQNQSVLLISI